MKARLNLILALVILSSASVSAQSDDELEIFGYFQPNYSHNFQKQPHVDSGSFVVQQLNLFLKRELDSKWLGLVNIEFVNSYSSSRKWGSLSLEEAWVRYRKSQRFNLKLGLHIPTFNHLNEIKNKTPLLPFIIRPLAYETSLGEVLPLEDLAPSQAFVSIYGAKPKGPFKLDYSLYLGNSPNIANTDNLAEGAISGEDVSETFLFGTRLGFRWKTVKAGVSASQDFTNNMQPLADVLPVTRAQLTDIPRTRLGSDFSWDWKKIYSESETTAVVYSNLPGGLEQEFDFSYSLLGYDLSDRWSIYTTTSIIGIESVIDNVESKTEVWAWSPGFVFQALDRVSLKGQYAWVRLRDRSSGTTTQQFNRFSGAISVIF